MRRLIVPATIVLLFVTAAVRNQEKEKPLIQDYVRAAISAPPESLAVDRFYKKYTDALGIAILSSERVPDAALLVARDIVIHMLAKRPDLRAEMLKKKMRVGV